MAFSKYSGVAPLVFQNNALFSENLRTKSGNYFGTQHVFGN